MKRFAGILLILTILVSTMPLTVFSDELPHIYIPKFDIPFNYEPPEHKEMEDVSIKTEVNTSGWAKIEVEKARDLGLIPLTLIEKDLTQYISRGEFAAVAVQLYETWKGETVETDIESPFTDISDNENKAEILKAYDLGITIGMSETTFDPDILITREQLATMLCRTYKKKEFANWTLATDDSYTLNYSGVQKFADDEDISEYAKPSVYFMVKYGVINGVGDNKFAPKSITTSEDAIGYAMATREQAIVMALRSFENLN